MSYTLLTTVSMPGRLVVKAVFASKRCDGYWCVANLSPYPKPAVLSVEFWLTGLNDGMASLREWSSTELTREEWLVVKNALNLAATQLMIARSAKRDLL